MSLESPQFIADDVISLLESTNTRHIHLFKEGASDKDLLKLFRKQFKYKKAAGGLVHHQLDDRYLFMKRYGRWDLPKGGIEKGENEVEAAVRETQEETGVQDLSVVRFLLYTYHIVHDGTRWRTKQTAWYHLETSSGAPLVPQTEEMIERAEWITAEQIETRLENSFPNIRYVVEAYHRD